MARKVSGFADKLRKQMTDYTVHCPVCGESIQFVKHIVSVTSKDGKSIRFKEKVERVCKCNRQEIFK
ncbi:MAG: hypothetical protein DRP91_02915 [Candidatus Neomarinimicrobiota bacterium]|nr:hypothetical protein [Candidatus Neomarinimicrobiota bacterium]MCD6099696.1 hypothetical protein [Candidatus Neomarinimicrobiota bacterium]RKY49041.1 MAG: hypothetical protein DRP88_00765 [Candidatus Neomarinimicrobiota bacterium]RKY49964.1 MAG: hypothetical protein DRP91_02915 [Candidatus Neomarinimicrobiota bacterium]RKY51818.1 MAG: hypothetical protein DRP92_06750 [Candidatus Neomarinimicrobiota bacterium]